MKAFKNLTRAEQRIRIVKDAIKQINTGTIVPKTGSYFNFSLKKDRWTISGKENLQKVIKRGVRCDVCAKGSLFLSCVLNVNKVLVEDSIEQEEFQSKKLKRWFSKAQLDTIEAAFEKSIIYDSTDVLGGMYFPTPLGKRAMNFGRKYSSDKARQLAILNNMLKNKGRFIP